MPDLIIKPTATSGNKLILQDQAGGAVLTTADSGATYANATLTAPTIANMANCTFPANHVIQTVTAQAASGTLVVNSGTENYRASADLTISVTGGNKLIVYAIGGAIGNENGTSTFVGGALNAIYSSTDHKLGQLNCWYPSGTGGASGSACGIWTIAGSGSISVAIHLGMQRNNTTHYGSWWIDDGDDYGKCFLTAQEVQA